jgi:hypothetical protein
MVQTADLQTECIKQSLRINVEMLFEWYCEDYQWTTSENAQSIPIVLCFITKYFVITSPTIQNHPLAKLKADIVIIWLKGFDM